MIVDRPLGPVEPMHWNFFVRMPHVAKLPLREQTRMYKLHLHEIDQLNAIRELSAKSKSWKIGVEGYLLQEDLSFLTQENGDLLFVSLLLYTD